MTHIESADALKILPYYISNCALLGAAVPWAELPRAPKGSLTEVCRPKTQAVHVVWKAIGATTSDDDALPARQYDRFASRVVVLRRAFQFVAWL